MEVDYKLKKGDTLLIADKLRIQVTDLYTLGEQLILEGVSLDLDEHPVVKIDLSPVWGY